MITRVDLVNEDGERQVRYVGSEAFQSTDECVAEAERQAREDSGDDSWTMDDWRAA